MSTNFPDEQQAGPVPPGSVPPAPGSSTDGAPPAAGSWPPPAGQPPRPGAQAGGRPGARPGGRPGEGNPFSPPPASGPPPPVPPPPVPPPPVARQLVRDPYSRLGGVASGIGHHYGIDVSLVRIGFVAFTLASGFGLLIYMLAWLIIPRADYWPPVAAAKPIRVFSGREAAIGLVVVGVLLTMFFSGSGLSQVLVPLVLVAGGVWMLSQPDAGEVARVSHAAPFQPVDTIRPDGRTGAPSAPPPITSPGAASVDPARPVPPPHPGAMPPGTPVGARRRRWRRLAFIPVVIVVALPIVAIVLLANADIDIEVSNVVVAPESADDLPLSINEDSADLLLDLSAFESSMFDGDPESIDVSVDFGRVEVVVPQGLTVSVDAAADVGDVTVFGAGDDGLDPQVRLDSDDPDIELEIDLDFGEILVRRAAATD